MKGNGCHLKKGTKPFFGHQRRGPVTSSQGLEENPFGHDVFLSLLCAAPVLGASWAALLLATVRKDLHRGRDCAFRKHLPRYNKRCENSPAL